MLRKPLHLVQELLLDVGALFFEHLLQQQRRHARDGRRPKNARQPSLDAELNPQP